MIAIYRYKKPRVMQFVQGQKERASEVGVGTAHGKQQAPQTSPTYASEQKNLKDKRKQFHLLNWNKDLSGCTQTAAPNAAALRA